jgi:neurotransmitter:Na+ symporter, NSS family
MSQAARKIESWGSRLGVIMAVAGSAVGLGNFLRFPGQAAQYGGGAFMIAYAISFIIIGLPIGWAEWTMGRAMGQRGLHSAPGMFAHVMKQSWSKYLGIIGIIIPVVIYMYYVGIEAWCLGYAVNFLRGALHMNTAEESSGYFSSFVGIKQDGAAMHFSWDTMLPFLIIVFLINFIFIYRGISKGIETVCNWGMPALIILATIVLIRVMTLGTPDASLPDNNVNNGLGYMWNPAKLIVEVQKDGAWTEEKQLVGAAMLQNAKLDIAEDSSRRIREITVAEQLLKPQLWLAAAGQIFFSLSVGFGVILCYASYLKKSDDVVLSGLSASAANEFCEVGLGGLITLPAAVAFLGLAGVAGQGTFGLGFNVLPLVFSKMPLGQFFGAMFFFMLFLAAITSSLSMLQPGIAFLEEALNIGRKASVAILGFITVVGAGFVSWFSADLKALDTLDFWVGTFLIFILATIQIIVFGWVWGVEKGFKEAHEGAAVRIPRVYRTIIKYICPAFLLVIFTMWVLVNVFGVNFSGGAPQISSYVTDLFINPNQVAWLSVVLVLVFAVFLALLVSKARAYQKTTSQPDSDS